MSDNDRETIPETAGNRRRFLAGTGAAAAGAWATPAIVRAGVAGAQVSDIDEPPPPPPPPPPPTTCDLRNWVRTRNFGSWTVAADGLSVFQSQNSAPTFFVSPDELNGITFDGFVTVETTSDDDYFGFAVGYNEPAVAPDAMQDYVLIDWKQFDQAGAIQGFTARRVTGSGYIMNSGTATSSQFFQQVSVAAPDGNGAMTILDTDLGPGRGWLDNREYAYRVEYQSSGPGSPGRLRFWIEPSAAPQAYPAAFAAGSLIFDIDSDAAGVDFPEGRIAFYNFSQPSVRYRQANCTT